MLNGTQHFIQDFYGVESCFWQQWLIIKRSQVPCLDYPGFFLLRLIKQYISAIREILHCLSCPDRALGVLLANHVTLKVGGYYKPSNAGSFKR
jgi:hypothetical protein